MSLDSIVCVHSFNLIHLSASRVSQWHIEVMFNPFRVVGIKFRYYWCWWRTKSPSEKWIAICGINRLFCELIGIRIFSDMKNYWYTFMSGVCFLVYLSLTFYTIQYYLFRREFVRVIECIYLIGPIVGVCYFGK